MLYIYISKFTIYTYYIFTYYFLSPLSILIFIFGKLQGSVTAHGSSSPAVEIPIQTAQAERKRVLKKSTNTNQNNQIHQNANEVQIEGVQTSAAAGSELLHTELMTKDIPDSLPQFGEPPTSWDKDGHGNDPVKHLKVPPFRIHQLNFGAGSCRVNDFRISPTCI